MRGVAIEDWSVTFLDFTWVVQDDDLGIEGSCFLGWIFFRIRAHVSSSDIFDGDVLDGDVLDGDVLDVESDVVAWNTFGKCFVVHLDGFIGRACSRV